VGSAEGEDRGSVWAGLEAAHQLGLYADRGPLLEVEDLFVELEASAAPL
jgi:hypothetical protein